MFCGVFVAFSTENEISPDDRFEFVNFEDEVELSGESRVGNEGTNIRIVDGALIHVDDITVYYREYCSIFCLVQDSNVELLVSLDSKLRVESFAG